MAVLSFDPHPLTSLCPEQTPPRLTRWEEREKLILAAGADRAVRLEPTPAFLALTAEEFIEKVVREQAVTGWVEGPDFRFGAGRRGDLDLLGQHADRLGFELSVVDPVETTLHDQTIVRVSSTLTRWLLIHGRVADASVMLGRDYSVRGRVTQGHRRGRTIGFPTANMDLGTHAPLLPADGVYAGSAKLPDGRCFPAAISIGTNPTFEGAARTVEPHLLDAPQDGECIQGLPEYGWELELCFSHWIRETLKFSGLEPLVSQLHRDRDRAAELMQRESAPA